MTEKLVITKHGGLRVLPANDEVLACLERWPKKISPIADTDPQMWGIATKDSDGELMGLRLSFGYYEDADAAKEVFNLYRVHLPSVIARMVDREIRATLLACAYLWEGPTGVCQTGYALFGRSDQAYDSGLELEDQMYDKHFGPGATELIFRFILLEAEIWSSIGYPQRTIDGLELVSWSDCGKLAVDFLVADDMIVFVRREFDEEWPFWGYLAENGISKIYHLPCMTVQIKGNMG